MKTHIPRDVAAAHRSARWSPAEMSSAGWAQAKADHARIRTVLRAPPEWSFTAATSGLPSAHAVEQALASAPFRAAQRVEMTKPRLTAQPFQPKLAIGRIDDPLEREADRVADSVASGRPVGAITVAPSSGVQRECAECEEANQALRRKGASPAAESGAYAPSAIDRVVAGPGKPLEPGLRQDLEARFGHAFGHVRVHADAAAAASARLVEARAYTVGQHVVFADDEFSPATAEGQQLLAHELTHVVQQGGGAATLRRQPRSKADQDREAAIERARLEGAFCTTAQSGTQSDAEEALRLSWGKSADRTYALSLGYKDRALIQKKQAVPPRLLSEIATKVRFFRGEAKASYLRSVGDAVINFGGSNAGLVILEPCAAARPDEADEDSESEEASPAPADSDIGCDIARHEYEIEIEGAPGSGRCADIGTDPEFKKNYFDSNIASAVGYSVTGTTWDNVAYGNFKVMLVKYRNGTSEYFALDDIGTFHFGSATQMSMLPSKYVKRRNGLVYPLDRGRAYLLSEYITPNIISMKNGLKYQVKDLQGLYTLLQTAGAFASIMGLYALGEQSFKASIHAFRRTGPARLPGRPLPGIGVTRPSSTAGGAAGGEGGRLPKVPTDIGEEDEFKGSPKKGKSAENDAAGSKRTSTIEETQSAGERTTTSGRGSGEYRPLSKNPDIGVLEVRDDGSVSIVSANRQDDLEPGVKVASHIKLANHPNGLGPIPLGAARYRMYMQNGKVYNVQPLGPSTQTPERVQQIQLALRRNRLLSDPLTIIDLDPTGTDDSLKKKIFF